MGALETKTQELMPLKYLLGIKSSAWTAEVGSWSFLSQHICSEMVQRVWKECGLGDERVGGLVLVLTFSSQGDL